jgi:hypothetical protein
VSFDFRRIMAWPLLALLVVGVGLSIAASSAAFAQAPVTVTPPGYVSLPTNFGRGADAEVREAARTTNYGASTELATRYATGVHNSVIYLQFDLTGVHPSQLQDTALRMTYRNTNWSSGRVHDKDFVEPDLQHTGLQYFGVPGAFFNESTINYNTAPGMTPDNVVGTKDFIDAATTYLGIVLYHEIIPENHYPVGGALDFDGSFNAPGSVEATLDAFLLSELLTNPQRVAVIAAVHLADGTPGEPNSWHNHNYLFNPKEQTTINVDPTYDDNDLDPNNPVGNLNGGQPNMGQYSPQLLLRPAVPEPSGVAPAAWAALAAVRWRRRRLIH